MKTVWLQRGSRRQALVFFAGWGMDERPFRRLTSSQYDVCVCFDYRDLDTDFALAALPNANRHGYGSGQPSRLRAPTSGDGRRLVVWLCRRCPVDVHHRGRCTRRWRLTAR